MKLSEIYEPQEDSFLMLKYVKKLAKGNVLDMGTGSGIQAISASKKKSVKKVVGVDISKKVIEHCKKQSKKITWIQSNLFKNLGKKYHGFFDTILFNSPYLPQEGKTLIKTIEGGKKGYEICVEFLEQARPFLKPKGIILLLFSSLSKPDIILNFADTMMYTQKIVSADPLFFEELYLYKFQKSDVFLELEKKGFKDIKFFDKGWRGMIFTSKYDKKKAAIKTKRRYSEAKEAIKKEARWLKFVNQHNIGPRFIVSGKGYIAYDFVEGQTFDKWMEKASKTRLSKVIREILIQCYHLDKLGVNKEEMHRPLTNVIITKKDEPVLIDFERMYKTKKPHNVTQFCQFLINRVAFLNKKGFKLNRNKIIASASRYKRDLDLFKEILKMIR